MSIAYDHLNPPMMACGHTANASNGDGSPSCIVCVGIHPGAETVIEMPDLTGRMARCTCGKEAPSDSRKLAFFESGLLRALSSCSVCNYAAIAHTDEVRARPHTRNTKLGDGHDFQPKDDPGHDYYYCGCRGWD